MYKSDKAIALEYLDALGGADPAKVVALVAESFRNEHHSSLGTGCVGSDEYARRLPGFFATFVDRNYDIVEVAVGNLIADGANDGDGEGDGSEVIVNYRFGADVDGTRIDIPGVMWISVRGGKVVRRLDCWDSLIFHHQTGTDPAK